jgi:hypothetical protein
MANTAKRMPHMGFVVEPYSLFLCYKITNLALAKTLISSDYEIKKTKIFAADEPDYYIIFGCVTAHTSVFWGSRIEMYVIAEHKTTGLLSWVIVDYDTNTNSHDPKHGLVEANSIAAVMTTTYQGKVLVDMQRNNGSHQLTVEADSTAGGITPLDQRLWLEGNLSIDYGTLLSNGKNNNFSLTFDPQEVTQALCIPPEQVTVTKNNWHPGLFAAQPTKIVCFPYAQHFVTNSYADDQLNQTVSNQADLINAVNELGDFSTIKLFSAKPMTKQLLIGITVSNTISSLLILYFIWQLI